MQVVGTYGFKRTSMDDVASAVGISRPALYQHFSNKQDIYRAMLQTMCEASLDAARQASHGENTLAKRLGAAIHCAVIEPHAAVEDWPHGAELLTLKGELGQDILDEWSRGLEALLQDVLQAEAGELAPDLTMVIVRTIEGTKTRGLKAAQMAQEIERLIHVVARAVAANSAG